MSQNKTLFFGILLLSALFFAGCTQQNIQTADAVEGATSNSRDRGDSDGIDDTQQSIDQTDSDSFDQNLNKPEAITKYRHVTYDKIKKISRKLASSSELFSQTNMLASETDCRLWVSQFDDVMDNYQEFLKTHKNYYGTLSNQYGDYDCVKKLKNAEAQFSNLEETLKIKRSESRDELDGLCTYYYENKPPMSELRVYMSSLVELKEELRKVGPILLTEEQLDRLCVFSK